MSLRFRSIGRRARFIVLAVSALTAPLAAVATPVPVSSTGATSILATVVPSSPLASAENNASRVEHIMLKRALKKLGLPTAEFYRRLFGPGLKRMQAAFPQVAAHKSSVGGVPVLIYEPRVGIAPANRDRVLINLHGGGFVSCFVECGGMESIPLVALTGIRVISVDYRTAPTFHYPAATEDVVAVYRAVLKRIPPSHVGLFGCSAGGILTAQSVAWFSRHHIPMPGAAGIFCAGGDPEGGDSRLIGSVLGDGEVPQPTRSPGAAAPLGYMKAVSPRDPVAYPAQAPAILATFPPTLVITGTRDFEMSSAVYLHSKLVAAGIDAELHVWEGARHAFFYDVRMPEAHQAYSVMATFFSKRVR